MRPSVFLLAVVATAVAPAQTLSASIFGGTGNEAASRIAVDGAGAIYVAGSTTSFDLPVLNAMQSTNSGTEIVFSSDAGATWRPVGNLLPDGAPVGSALILARDPIQPARVYAARGAVVFKSSDLGSHFAPSRLPLASVQSFITGLLVDSRNPNVLYAGATVNGGVFKSMDGGETWRKSVTGLPEPGFIDSISADPLHPGTLWVWAGTGGYVSTDGAESWKPALAMPPGSSILGGYRFVFDATQPGLIYGPALAGNDAGVQKSTDGGLTWRHLPVPFPAASLTADPVRSGYLYGIDPSLKLFYRSTDAGITWEPFPFPGRLNGPLGVDPAQPDTLIAGGFRSVDGGRTWAATNVSRDIRPVFSIAAPGTIFASAPITSDAFLAKFEPDGKTLVFATYFGGMGIESAAGLGVDPQGNIWLAGTSDSVDLPVTADALQPGIAGESSIFLARFTADGQLLYSTALGNSASARSLAIDSAGNLWVAANTSAADFHGASGSPPSSSDFESRNRAVVAKLDVSGSRLIFSTYLGGSHDDQAGTIAVDPADNVVITGTTYSPDFPVVGNAVQSSSPSNAARPRPFLVKLRPDGQVVFSTYFGGTKPAATPMGSTERELGIAAAADGSGNIFVTGATSMVDFPTTGGAYQTALRGGCEYPAFSWATGLIGAISTFLFDDVFLMKLSPDGRILYSTLLGGSCYDRPAGIAVARDGSVFLTGETDSGDFPMARPFEGPPARASYRSFIAAFDPAGARLTYSTYLSAGSDPAVALGPGGILHVAGAIGERAQTIASTSFIDPFPVSRTDVYTARIDLEGGVDKLSLTGVLNAFSFRSGAVAPGEIVALMLPNLTPDQSVDAGLNGPEAVSDRLGGVDVLFDGRPASVVSVFPGRVVAIVPNDLIPRTRKTIQVVSNTLASNAWTVDVAAAAVGLLSVDGSGQGLANARNQDGAPNTFENPARSGDLVTLYVTGVESLPAGISTVYGPVDVASMDGFVPGIFSAWIHLPAYGPNALRQIPVTLFSGASSSQTLWIYME